MSKMFLFTMLGLVLLNPALSISTANEYLDELLDHDAFQGKLNDSTFLMTDAFRVRLPADLIISGQALEANISKGRVLFLGKVRRVGSCLQVPFGIGVMMTCGVFLPEMEINTEASIKGDLTSLGIHMVEMKTRVVDEAIAVIEIFIPGSSDAMEFLVEILTDMVVGTGIENGFLELRPEKCYEFDTFMSFHLKRQLSKAIEREFPERFKEAARSLPSPLL